jgi:hypothetical protein
MGMFAETAIVDYRSLFGDNVFCLQQTNEVPPLFSVCSKQTEICCFCFPSAAKKQKLPFSVSTVFCI